MFIRSWDRGFSMRAAVVFAFIAISAFFTTPSPAQDVAVPIRKLYPIDFDNVTDSYKAMMAKSKKWRIGEDKVQGDVLELFKPAREPDDDRALANLTVLPQPPEIDGIKDTRINLKARCTSLDDDNPELIFVIHYQDPTHFYYASLANKMDEDSHGIFVVDGNRVKRFNAETPQKITWDDKWHDIRVNYYAPHAEVTVFFDDFQRQWVMYGYDRTFKRGRLAVGSAGCSGMFDLAVVWGNAIEK